MMSRLMGKRLLDDVLAVKARVIEAIPTGISFAAIIIALAQLIVEYQKQALENDE